MLALHRARFTFTTFSLYIKPSQLSPGSKFILYSGVNLFLSPRKSMFLKMFYLFFDFLQCVFQLKISHPTPANAPQWIIKLANFHLEKVKSVNHVCYIISSGNCEGQLPSFHAKCSEGVPGKRAN